MASVNSLGTGTYFGVSSGFFNSMLGADSQTSATSGIYDYATVRNGSYYKLLKAYYNGSDTASSMLKSSSSVKEGTTAEDEKNAVSVRDSAAGLKQDAAKLTATGSRSVFNKKTVTAEDGTQSQEYDNDAIYKAVSAFVDDYNSVIKAAGDSEYNSVLSSASNMVNMTNANKELLASVGISIGTDNKLSISEEAFKNADMTDVKSIFNGVGSYAYGIAASASSMYNSSISQLAQINGSSYTSSGNFSNYSYSGSLYNTYL